jgi:signal transduction histidine kinase
MPPLRAPKPVIVDAGLAFAVLLVTLVGGVIAGRDDSQPPLTRYGVLLLVAQTAPLVFRRRWPFTVGIVTGAATAAYGIARLPDLPLYLGPMIALYTIASTRSRRVSLAVLGGIFVTVVVANQLAGDSRPINYYSGLLIPSLFWAIGDGARSRRQYLAEVEARAAALERDRIAEARRAVEDERARIARELHDVVAHHVSMIVVQAEAFATAQYDSETVASFDTLAENGREALTELRRLLNLLRDPEGTAPLTPEPGIGRLDGLVDELRGAGLPVDLRIEGRRRGLPEGVELSAYRIIQEALTNTLRHAGRARALVVVRYLPEAIEVEVVDDGRGGIRAEPDSTKTTGHGLVGIRERVALHNGELDAGPLAGGGFRLRAVIPVPASLEREFT